MEKAARAGGGPGAQAGRPAYGPQPPKVVRPVLSDTEAMLSMRPELKKALEGVLLPGALAG